MDGWMELAKHYRLTIKHIISASTVLSMATDLFDSKRLNK